MGDNGREGAELNGEASLEEKVRAAINELYPHVDRDAVTLGDFRQRVSRHLGLGGAGLDAEVARVNAWIREALTAAGGEKETSEDHVLRIVDHLGQEAPNYKNVVHFITISRVLVPTLERTDLRDTQELTRQDVLECVQKAFDVPLPSVSAGRKRAADARPLVRKLVVFQEAHEDGSRHYHAAVLLHQSRQFLAAKRTLRQRDHLAAHFSATHTQFWSAVRYGHIPTLAKPVVDEQPLSWCSENGWNGLDLFAESQEPWCAGRWKKRREQAEKAAYVNPAKKARFTKLDLTAVILAKDLCTPTAVLAYAQDHGSEATQVFVSNRQKHLKEYLAEAHEWGQARAQAALDQETDWELVCRHASQDCPCGVSCTYAAAAQAFFEANATTLSQMDLAVALRKVLLGGPSKTARAPMLVGPTNSGKSTIVLPFDDVFGFGRVFHKPALGSAFALRNIVKGKRFLLWDDYRPVEYGQRTIPVSTFLSLFQGQPFEVQVSQAFNDGNVDFQWRRGCVLTAKDESLWDCLPGVCEEDVRHMKSRLHLFRCTATVKYLKDTSPCAVCLCRWIHDACREHDSLPILAPPICNGATSSAQPALSGLPELAARAQLPEAHAKKLEEEILSLGAVHVKELLATDWRSLVSFNGMRPFEQRRLLAALDTTA